MTTSPAREPPGGVVIIHMDRVDDPGIDPNSTGYAVSFRGATAIAAVLLGRVEGLYALGGARRVGVTRCLLDHVEAPPAWPEPDGFHALVPAWEP
jgi:hypothetical protein